MTGLSREQLVAWAAGFFDGEGSVIITLRYRKRDAAYQRIAVTQKVKEPLLRLQMLFGGPIRKEKRISPRHADMFVWYARNYVAIAALDEIAPYLIVKHGQYVVAKEFMEGVRPHHGGGALSEAEEHRREAVGEAMRLLNITGPR